MEFNRMFLGHYQINFDFLLRLAPPFPAAGPDATFRLQCADLTLKSYTC